MERFSGKKNFVSIKSHRGNNKMTDVITLYIFRLYFRVFMQADFFIDKAM